MPVTMRQHPQALTLKRSASMNYIYCTYLTIYSGQKLPPFYIGSTRVSNIISKGYHGSVSSRKYKHIWLDELANNPQHFKTIIITRHLSRHEASIKELYFHEKLNVVKSSMYINESTARPNGFFGRDVSGKNNPRYGTTWGDNHPKGMLGKKHTEEAKMSISRSGKGKPAWNKGQSCATHSIYMKNKMQGNQYLKGHKYSKACCILCHKEISVNRLKVHHKLCK